jgi:hypothetical protein
MPLATRSVIIIANEITAQSSRIPVRWNRWSWSTTGPITARNNSANDWDLIGHLRSASTVRSLANNAQ